MRYFQIHMATNEAEAIRLQSRGGLRRTRRRRSAYLSSRRPVPYASQEEVTTSGLGYGLGGLAGGALATYLGKPELAPAAAGFGAQFSDMSERRYKRFFGMGDYTLRSNSLITGGGSGTQALIQPQGSRAVRIIYREYIGDVFTHATVAGAFNLVSYPLNPGLLQTFPWLAPIALQYEQYTPLGMVFEFKSTSSEYVATQALGSVIMSTEYDVMDPAPANKQEMLNTCYSNEAKPSSGIIHGVECDPRDTPNKIYFVRHGSVTSGDNLRDYDIGFFNIATQGGATANLNLGSLYIHYDIVFRKEQIYGGIPGKGLLYDVIYGIAGVDDATPLPVHNGLTNVRSLGSTPLMTIGGLGTTINFPRWVNSGTWLLEYVYVSTAVGVSALGAFSATTNCRIPNTTTTDWFFENGIGAAVPQTFSTATFNATAAQVTSLQRTHILVTGEAPVVTMAASTLFGTPLYCWIRVLQVGNAWE